MPVTNESSAPYAPAHAMKLIINRYRDRGMQTPITTEVLERAGISESLISRTLQALYVLDLIDENGLNLLKYLKVSDWLLSLSIRIRLKRGSRLRMQRYLSM